jgi:hypothetical protein
MVYVPNGVVFSQNKERNYVKKWMELNTIMLSEISQTQKDKYCIFSLIHGIYTQTHKHTYDIYITNVFVKTVGENGKRMMKNK